jgi:hypothetical protein
MDRVLVNVLPLMALRVVEDAIADTAGRLNVEVRIVRSIREVITRTRIENEK